MIKKRIAILGSTGSIGTQALEVIDQHPEHFDVEVLTAGNNFQLLIKQARKVTPNVVVISNKKHYAKVKDALFDLPIKVYSGKDALNQVMYMDTIDVVLAAMVGFAGLEPVLTAINQGKQIALANKETLVVAGRLVIDSAKQNNVSIIPVDSEHSAIFQCLTGESCPDIEKIFLTASGGPFHKYTGKDLETVTPYMALNHPTWDMGNKVTIDSASLMNKGLEVIEAHWLFGVPAKNIEVVVHPQSIIHSMVMFRDGSIKAQMGLPDMKLPIQYAFTYPFRLNSDFERLDMEVIQSLTFEPADKKKFRNLALAYEALDRGGNSPCILNASNEVVVNAFLNEQISFVKMPEIISQCLDCVAQVEKPTLDDLVSTDKEARIKTLELINK